MSAGGWLTREQALLIARQLGALVGAGFKSCHVQGTGTGGRIKITLFIVPLASKAIPEPDAFIFGPEDLSG